MIILASIVGYIAVAIAVGRTVGYNVYSSGGLYNSLGVQNIQRGDSSGALMYAAWAGVLWPLTFCVLVVAVIMALTTWAFSSGGKRILEAIFLPKRARK